MMRYENLLASRYIKAQKRQSVFTVISITTAVAVIAMIFILYSVCMNNLENTFYSAAPYHLLFSELTEEQGEALADFEEVRSVKLGRTKDGVSASVLFGSDIGDRELWLYNAAKKIGALQQYERSRNDSMRGAYEWNDNLMMINGIGDGAHLFRLRIFCIFFIFAVLAAFALRLIIDTAFEVSSKERERHYGVLQSIGATPEQIVRIITLEGLRLCVIAIPCGLVAGIGLAYVMYNVLLKAGLSDLFQGMTVAKLYLPFSVDWKMLLVAAAVGTAWVFFSAYGVGMRIIKKSPMEAIVTRTDKVEKVRKRTLSGMLFGISGSIASRNARRQKKRFFITVLTLTVSITMFALFSTLTETVERSITDFFPAIYYGDSVEEAADIDFVFGIGNPAKGISFSEAAEELEDSGIFENIAVSAVEQVQAEDTENTVYVYYVNRERYTRLFGEDAPVSYDELLSSGGYLCNSSFGYYEQYADILQSGTMKLTSIYRTLPEGTDAENMSRGERVRNSVKEKKEHTVDIIGSVSKDKTARNDMFNSYLLIGAIGTHEKIASDWFGDDFGYEYATVSLVKPAAGEYRYNSADLKKAQNWFEEHSEILRNNNDEESFDSIYSMNYYNEEVISDSIYNMKLKMQSVMASIRAGVLILNLLIALAALINLMNIISTGIANRRSELASLQCVGMTDRQLDRMAVIECLQFTGAAAIFSALICALLILGTRAGLEALVNASFTDESEETKKLLKDMIRFDCVMPFVRIALASLTAFAAGCVTSLVMLRRQNTDSLSDQIRGSEMKLDARKSHILRNSLIAAAGVAALVIAGFRTYSVVSYRKDRAVYEKAGYLNLVESDGFKMNVYSTGAEKGRHTIVGIAGQDVNCFPIITKELNKRLGEENTLVYPDRAGYGFSDDSFRSQTLEQVVEDYRTGLKNAGFEAPYVLMGHSYGSYYALWWLAEYPEEVEAIVFLDGTWLTKNDLWMIWSSEEYPEGEVAAAGHRLFMRTWLGLDRLFPIEEGSERTFGRSLFTDEEYALWKLCDNRFQTAARTSETLNEEDAAHELRKVLQPTKTPKLYFSTMFINEEQIRENYEFSNADIIAAGYTPKLDPETTAKAEWQRDAWSYQDIYDNYLTPFLEQCGNYRLVSIGCDHGLFYARKPDEVADTILDFLAETTE